MRWLCVLPLLLACGGRQLERPTPGVRVIAGELDATALLAPTATRSSKAGAGALALVTRGLLREGERTGAFIEPQATSGPSSCVFLFARAAPSVSDLDVSVFTDDGEPLAQDEEPDATPAVLLCPPYPTRMYVSARTATGEGLVAIGAQAVPQNAAAQVRRAASVKGGAGAANRRLDQWPELEVAVRRELARLGPSAREARRVGLPAERTLSTSVSEEVPADSCASLLLVPDSSLFALDIELEDETGALLMRSARAVESLANFQFCTDVPRTITASFRPHVGRGLVGAVWLLAPRDAVPAAYVLASRGAGAPKAWLAAEVKRLSDARERRGDKKVRDTSFTVRPSALFAETLSSLSADACHAVRAVVGAPNARTSLSLLLPDGRPIGQRQGGASAGMMVCGLGTARVAVGIREAQGAGRLLVHRTPLRIEGAARVPIAASRIATLLDELAAPVARALPLQGSSELPMREVPRGQCLLVAAAAEDGSAELRVAEANDAGGERIRGDADVRWVRLCASDAARTVTLSAAASPGLVAWATVPMAP